MRYWKRLLNNQRKTWYVLKRTLVVCIVLLVMIGSFQFLLTFRNQQIVNYLDDRLLEMLLADRIEYHHYQFLHKITDDLRHQTKYIFYGYLALVLYSSTIVILYHWVLISLRRNTMKLLQEKEAGYISGLSNNQIILQGVSHELSSWMGGLEGTCCSLHREFQELSREVVPASCKQCARWMSINSHIHTVVTMQKTIRTAAVMIENLSTYGKLTRQNTMEVNNIKPLLRQAVRYSRFSDTNRFLPEATLQFKDNTKGTDYRVRISPGAFLTVIQNVVKNAIEATYEIKKTGNSPNYTPLVLVTIGATSDQVLISVTDNGVGMSPSKVEELSKLYVTTKDKGTGIGLHLIKSNLDMMDIPYSITSSVGIGTEFTITIPFISTTEESIDDMVTKMETNVQVPTRMFFEHCLLLFCSTEKIVVDITTIYDNITKLEVGDNATVEIQIDKKRLTVIGPILDITDYQLTIAITDTYKDHLLRLTYDTL